MRLLLLCTASLIASVCAVFPDEAYHVDYHHALLGIPQQDATFFHQPVSNSKASLLYTLSESGAIGAVNPKDGSLVWRQFVSPASNATNAILRAGESQDVVLSAVDNTITAWGASDGKQIWKEITADGKISDIQILESAGIESADAVKDAIVVADDGRAHIKRLEGRTGRTVWSHTDERFVSTTAKFLEGCLTDCSGDTPLKVSIAPKNIFYVSLHKPLLSGGLKIKVTTIDADSGKEIRHQTLSSDGEVSSPEDVLFVGSSAAVPIVIWSDKSRSVLKMNILGTTGLSVFQTDSGDKIDKISVLAPTRPDSKPHFLIAYESTNRNWAEVYRANLDRQQVFKGYDLPQRNGKGSFAASAYGTDVFFTRVVKGGIEVYGSQSETAVARYTMDDFGVIGLQDYPEPVFAVSEVLPRVGTSPAVRAAFLLSSGDWVLNLNGDYSWSRPEALSLPMAGTIARVSQKDALAQELAAEAHSNAIGAYFHRLTRHVKDLEHFPDFIRKLPNMVLGSAFGPSTDAGNLESAVSKADSYGFHKLAVVATRNGRLVALDTGSHGAVKWNIPRPDYTADKKWESIRLHAAPGGVIRLRSEDGTYVFNATTGKFLRKSTESNKLPAADKVVRYQLVDGVLKGTYGPESSIDLWTFTPSSGEKIVDVLHRPRHDPVASIGRVLGDRRVLYKYLNPNAVLVVATDGQSSVLSTYLVDTVSGNVLTQSQHTGVDTTRPIPAVISENWFCYSYTSIAESRGPHLVISELYESSIPNDRGGLGTASNYSALQPSVVNDTGPYVASQSYQIPEEISHLTVSQTSQGITTRLLMAVLPWSNSIVGIPLTAIDPRRTVGKDPTTSEQSEGLTKYLPLLDFDPKWYLNHKREVYGITDILTVPTVLESTSIVFAYGFDIFGTRISPSFSFDVLGKEFNKVQMLITVAALAVGVLVVAPLVSLLSVPFTGQMTAGYCFCFIAAISLRMLTFD